MLGSKIVKETNCTQLERDYLSRDLGDLGGLAVLSGQHGLSSLIKLELGDFDVGSINRDRDRLTVHLFAGNFFDMDNPLFTVNLNNLAFTALPGTTNNLDDIVLLDRDGANVVLFTEFLGKRGGHHDSSFAGGSSEVSLSALTTGR